MGAQAATLYNPPNDVLQTRREIFSTIFGDGSELTQILRRRVCNLPLKGSRCCGTQPPFITTRAKCVLRQVAGLGISV